VRTSFVLALAVLASAEPSIVTAADLSIQETATTTDVTSATESSRATVLILSPPLLKPDVNEMDVRRVRRRVPAGRTGDVRSFGYARLGYGAAFADSLRRAPAIGLGYRAERESLALDVSFLNLQLANSFDETGGYVAGSFMKLEALHLTKPDAVASPYFGGGASVGIVGVARATPSSAGDYRSDWTGIGLQGELTAGYEFLRTSSARVFIQANATLPFYLAASKDYTFRGDVSRTDRRYVPSLTVSMGLGWPWLRP